MPRSSLALVVLLLAAGVSHATPVRWTLSNVTFEDGGTATGSFVFDAAAGVPCGSGAAVCGSFSAVNIVTTSGTAVGGAAYGFVCGTQVVTCNGLLPNSTEVLFLASAAADQTGRPAIAFFFAGVFDNPPAGLTDLGGIIDIGGSSNDVGLVQEAPCFNATCGGPGGATRFSSTGFVVGAVVPEPATVSLLAAAAIGFGVVRRRRREAARPIA